LCDFYYWGDDMHHTNAYPSLKYYQWVWLLLLLTTGQVLAQQGWLTEFEKSGYSATPDYEQTLTYLARLDSASQWISLQSFGKTPQGRELPLLIVSKNGEFTPEAARAS
jgi:hypothetical protein